tara:strand:+ start:96567 stop:96749 length:183 start_codon:yes stop_codon:yes gene_type:complete
MPVIMELDTASRRERESVSRSQTLRRWVVGGVLFTGVLEVYPTSIRQNLQTTSGAAARMC